MKIHKIIGALGLLIIFSLYISFLVNIAGWNTVLISMGIALTGIFGVMYFLYLLEK